MILLCTGCGWRINQRYLRDINPEDVGKYMIYKHKPFCSEGCIELAKRYPNILDRVLIPSDWEENGVIREWKKDRKVNRKR